MTTFQEAATYLLNIGGVTLIQLFALGGPALLLIALLSWLSGNVALLASRALGRSTYYFLFGWLGTMIHEIAHLVVALLFRHQTGSKIWTRANADKAKCPRSSVFVRVLFSSVTVRYDLPISHGPHLARFLA
jgi:hypothetical protein